MSKKKEKKLFPLYMGKKKERKEGEAALFLPRGGGKEKSARGGRGKRRQLGEHAFRYQNGREKRVSHKRKTFAEQKKKRVQHSPCKTLTFQEERGKNPGKGGKGGGGLSVEEALFFWGRRQNK